jgi:hypothetical protein
LQKKKKKEYGKVRVQTVLKGQENHENPKLKPVTFAKI